MRAISLKLSPGLHARLDRAARKRKRSKSELVRAALEQFLNREPRHKPKRALSALELAGDLVGCVTGSGDLSTNPKHMEGYGE